jgi:hypothetical protein
VTTVSPAFQVSDVMSDGAQKERRASKAKEKLTTFTILSYVAGTTGKIARVFTRHSIVISYICEKDHKSSLQSERPSAALPKE